VYLFKPQTINKYHCALLSTTSRRSTRTWRYRCARPSDYRTRSGVSPWSAVAFIPFGQVRLSRHCFVNTAVMEVSRDISLSVVTVYVIGVRFPVGTEVLLLAIPSRRTLGPIEPLFQLASWVKQPGLEAGHSPPSDIEFKNAWNMSTPPYVLVDLSLITMHKGNLRFICAGTLWKDIRASRVLRLEEEERVSKYGQ
jgi:hypothetical protein